jgi:hypothetical protein
MKKTFSRAFRQAVLIAIATGIGAFSGLGADAVGKATPPYVWPQVKTKAEADTVKPGDSIAMICSKCKTLTVTTVTQDTKTRSKLISGEKHLCPGCSSTITVVGSKAHNTEVIKHVCKACGENSAFCCVTKPGASATAGMEKP